MTSDDVERARVAEVAMPLIEKQRFLHLELTDDYLLRQPAVFGIICKVVAALAEQPGAGWRPIAEARGDGWLLLGRVGKPLPVVGMLKARQGWVDTDHMPLEGSDAPTHFQPLPAPPADRPEGERRG